MLKNFYPYEYVSNVFDIDFGKLYALGYRAVIFDIDNTLVHHGADSTPEVDKLFKEIKGIGFKTLLLSDNSEERIKRFIKNIESMYIPEAGKPKTDNYFRAIDMLDVPKKEIVYVGDQIFTDIYGANKSGIASILVDFLRRDNETKIGKKRQLERVILKIYSLNKACQHRIGDICTGRVN